MKKLNKKQIKAFESGELSVIHNGVVYTKEQPEQPMITLTVWRPHGNNSKHIN